MARELIAACVLFASGAALAAPPAVPPPPGHHVSCARQATYSANVQDQGAWKGFAFSGPCNYKYSAVDRKLNFLMCVYDYPPPENKAKPQGFVLKQPVPLGEVCKESGDGFDCWKPKN